MKLKYSFEAVDMGDTVISVPIGEGANQIHGVLKLNKEGQEILDLLREETTEEKIVYSLTARYDNDRTQLTSYVKRVVTVLRDAALLEE